MKVRRRLRLGWDKMGADGLWRRGRRSGKDEVLERTPVGRTVGRPTVRVIQKTKGLQGAQVALALVGGDDGAVFLPLRALVLQEEVEDVLAEDLGDELGACHHVD